MFAKLEVSYFGQENDFAILRKNMAAIKTKIGEFDSAELSLSKKRILTNVLERCQNSTKQYNQQSLTVILPKINWR